MNQPAIAREPVAVSILDREFLIACTPAEKPGLIASAAYLDGKMREVKRGSNVAGFGFDRIAVLAALNITHELVAMRSRDEREATEIAQGLATLKAKLDAALPGSLQ